MSRTIVTHLRTCKWSLREEGCFVCNTVELLYNGHFGTSHFVLYRDVVLSSEVKMYREGTSKCVLCRKVSRRLRCTSTIEKGPQSVSFIERFFSIVSFILSEMFYCMYVCTSNDLAFADLKFERSATIS